jgi:alpha-soluble NSF attachment protein
MGKSRGDEELSKAEKKANAGVGWFGSNSSKWEEAGDIYRSVRYWHLRLSFREPSIPLLRQHRLLTVSQAANAYKVEQRWVDAGKAFEL